MIGAFHRVDAFGIGSAGCTDGRRRSSVPLGYRRDPYDVARRSGVRPVVVANHPVGALAWVVLLIVTGVGSGISFAQGAAAFGAANVIVGVLAYQGVAWLIRGFVRTRRPAQQG